MFISDSLTINNNGHLAIGGADVVSLAEKYGTPLYIMDEDKIRRTCREYNNALKECYGDNFLVFYASKAFSSKYIYKVIDSEGFGTDVVSGGELYTALKAGFPAGKIAFHGNNKTPAEIEFALKNNIRDFVVDNVFELHLLDETAKKLGVRAKISFRIKPGVDAHTHDFIKTGQIDSKFGVALENGEAFDIIKEALTLSNIELCGVHCHIGSQIFDAEPFSHAAEIMMQFMASIKNEFGYELSELNLGGGFGIRYTEKDDPNSIYESVKNFTDTVKCEAQKHGLKLPFISIEPGRSVVAESGITVYTVGSVKNIPGVRTYVSVDGGMTDNPRYALYGAEYMMLLPERPSAKPSGKVTVAGRNCESGDLLGEDVPLPEVTPGDLLTVLTTGAYNYSMASNYNRVPRPPVVMVNHGEDKLIIKRETYEDLIANDLM
ncbi:MAG: diaminopimelate decarboxylase [Oscillospiraceae bacterium]|nr:diaminopimelate decarboxylase [Oscillospiraceae bacterium]